MTVPFEALAAVSFTPAPFRKLERSAGAQWRGLSLGPDGEIFAHYFEPPRGFMLYSGRGREEAPVWPDGRPLYFSFVQRFSDGALLVIAPRALPGESNAAVFRPDGSLSHAFHAGDGINTVLVDGQDRIWVGYYDEGVFGGSGPRERHPGWEGLARFSRDGVLEFGFNGRFEDSDPERFIADIYALTLDDAGVAWFCPYTEFFLARAQGDVVDFVLEEAPVHGAGVIAVAAEHIAFFGGYRQQSIVTVVELASRRLRRLQLLDGGGTPLQLGLLTSRGAQAVGLDEDSLYRLDVAVLLEHLGVWDENNTSTIDSALAFAASRQSGGATLIPQGTPQGPVPDK